MTNFTNLSSFVCFSLPDNHIIISDPRININWKTHKSINKKRLLNNHTLHTVLVNIEHWTCTQLTYRVYTDTVICTLSGEFIHFPINWDEYKSTTETNTSVVDIQLDFLLCLARSLCLCLGVTLAALLQNCLAQGEDTCWKTFWDTIFWHYYETAPC